MEIFDQVYEFVEESGLHEVQITIQTPFPGTPLFQRLEREGRIIDTAGWKKCTLFDINYLPSKMSIDALSKGFKKLTVKLYSDLCTGRRKNRFRKVLRQLAGEKRERLKLCA